MLTILLVAGIGAVAAALALIAAILLPTPTRAAQTLDNALRAYRPSPRRRLPGALRRSASSAAGAVRVAAERGRAQREKRKRESLGRRLERAGWSLRSSEFNALRWGGAVAGLVLGRALGAPAVAIGLAATAYALPPLLLSRQIDRRGKAFTDQLPDTLQLLAATLEAGHGVLQGMDAVVRQSLPPTSIEFSRALAEVRLGAPLQEALESMSDRVGGDDFKWVVLAMNVNREIGGNLSSLLRSVAEALRTREQLRRQVRVLSSEGRISGAILGVLPLALTAYIATVNPSYLGVLTGSAAGRLMSLTALALMGVGGLWMRRIVRIEA